jgi:UDP-glucose 4-epimerase
MHFLITGGNGFIGSHLTSELVRRSVRVTIIDDLRNAKAATLPPMPGVTLIQKDLLQCTPGDLPHDITAVAHLAATPSVGRSWETPLSAHHNNLSSTVHVLELCAALQIKRLVFASSAAVYGDVGIRPQSEDISLLPQSPYGLQKAVSESYGRLFAPNQDLSFIALRLFNVYGPGQDSSSMYSGVIATFLSAAQEGRPLLIHGDGDQTRDFVSVQDVAVAFHKALTLPEGEPGFAAFNVATGVSTTIADLAGMITSLHAYRHSAVVRVEEKVGSIRHSQADVSKARDILKFSASRSLREGLSELARWRCDRKRVT